MGLLVGLCVDLGVLWDGLGVGFGGVGEKKYV